jgi:hypothetical protein
MTRAAIWAAARKSGNRNLTITGALQASKPFL